MKTLLRLHVRRGVAGGLQLGLWAAVWALPGALRAETVPTPGPATPIAVASAPGTASADEPRPARVVPVDLVGPGACARCHPAVAKQWAASTHAHSSLDNPWYRGSLRNFKRDRPAELAFCGKCHDPALMARNALDPEAGGPEAQAGVGCALCHSLTEDHARLAQHGRTNGEFTLTAAPIPLGVIPPPGTPARDAAAPRTAHGERVLPAELRATSACAACHEVRLTEAVTAAHWQRGQSDWFDWYDGPWAGRGVDVILRPPGSEPDPKRPAGHAPGAAKDCVDCHMRKVAVPERERGRDAAGTVRDHRFLGGHVALARLRGDAETEADMVAHLKGAIALDLTSARPGHLDVVLRNIGVGHAFPGGTQDAKQVWLEVTTWDASGKILSQRGQLNDDGRLPEDVWLVRARPVNADADPVPGRAAWTQRGVVTDTRLRPGIPQVARFAVPADAVRARVRLNLRRFGPDDVALLCGADAPAGCRTPPVTAISEAEVVLKDGQAVTGPRPWKLLIAHAMGLSAGLPEHVADAAPVLAAAAASAPPGAVELALAKGRYATVLGRTDDVVTALKDVEDPRARWIEANALVAAFRFAPARAAVERLLKTIPDDRRALALAARLRALTGDPAGALAAADTLLALDPHYEHAMLQRLLALRALGRPEADEAEAVWLRHRRPDELDRTLRDAYRLRHPGDHTVNAMVGPD